MTQKYHTAYWSIDLPSGWIGEDENDCITVYRADIGTGALQISSYIKSSGFVTDADIQESALGGLPEDTRLSSVICGMFTGFYGEFQKEEVFGACGGLEENRHWSI